MKHDADLARRLYAPATETIAAEILAGTCALCETVEGLAALPSLKAIDTAMSQCAAVRANLQRLRVNVAGRLEP